MDIAILYEKVTLKDNDKTFILKPIGTIDGKYEKDNGIFTSNSKKYYEFDDAKRLPIDTYFIGNPTTLNSLQEFDPEIEDSEQLKKRYMDSFVSDVILAKIKDDAVVITAIDVDTMADDGIDEIYDEEIEDDEGFTIDKVPDDAELSIAILYEKTLVTGTENPTYYLRPIGVMYGFCDEERTTIVNDTDRFISYYSKENLEKSDTVYFGNVIDVRYLMDDVDINDNEAFEEVCKKYYATFEKLGTYISIKDDQMVVCQIDIDTYTMQSNTPLEETENDEIIRDTASDALELLDEELTDEEEDVLMEYYKLFAKFLFIGYSINDITNKDITANTYNYVLKTFNEMTMAIKGLGLDKKDIELDDENIIGKSNKDVSNNNTVRKTETEPISEVVKDNETTYDPNKVKYPDYSIEDLYKGITDVVIGQDEQVMQIVSMLYKRLVELELGNMTSQFGMLITGSTGVGKSEILKMFASLTNLPIQFMDATQLTKQGYVGRGIEDYLMELAITCKGKMDKMTKAIMILDEVDKIRASGDINDVSGKAVQDMMLKFMDGTTYQFQYRDNMYALDSRTMTTISAGAFTDLYHQKKKSNLGFGGKEQIEEESIVKTKDFIDFGMTDEFMGRHYAQIHLNDLNSETMLRILEMSKKSPIKLQEAIYKRLGVDAVFTDEYKKLVVDEAVKRKIGARSLAGIVGETTWLPIREVDAHRGEYNKVIFDGDVIADPKRYVLRRD